MLHDKEPTTIDEAFMSPAWTAAAQDEYKALLANHTWDLVPLPEGRRTVGCKWIFKVKRYEDGTVAQYKGRLVVKVSRGWSLRQVDINNSFLNGDLTEEIYMTQPPGFEHPQTDGRPLFVPSKADNSLFIRYVGPQLVLVLVYIDDIIITGNDPSSIDHFVQDFNDQFYLKDLGQLSYFLGIEVTHTSSGIFLSQRKYIMELLQRASMDKSNASPTPMVSICCLSVHEGNPVENEGFFRNIVGALQYVVITRPDITFSVNKVCQYMHEPLDTDFKAVKIILRYLQGTLDFGLQFTRHSKLTLESYSDASWTTETDDRRSTSGFCVFLGGNLISWSSRKQQVVSRSTAEVEYQSLAHVTVEIVWIQSLLSELGVSI
ncbi:putative LRR receptor-like serine/threonine-protein kinase [Gossypium australe]|uniref:Putative LRR receptor-like serine/threonine-protein kinase n=1 Tax=Gossypium australe TaxID=47621 RepID=A0A5B6V7N2_9ROSI|nr:putative LRR receptor-like serine/threonine-protein kinase [Gossypium australe]